jgi:hypothetical protein
MTTAPHHEGTVTTGRPGRGRIQRRLGRIRISSNAKNLADN